MIKFYDIIINSSRKCIEIKDKNFYVPNLGDMYVDFL